MPKKPAVKLSKKRALQVLSRVTCRELAHLEVLMKHGEDTDFLTVFDTKKIKKMIIETMAFSKLVTFLIKDF